MQHRRATGQTGLSIGWGLWQTASGMSGGLSDTDVARMGRIGAKAMSNEQGLALLDAAHRHGHAHLVAADLNTRMLAGKPAVALPALLRAFAGGQGSARPTAAIARQDIDWAGKLSVLTAEEQHRTLLDLVRTHAAVVLGHAGADAVRADVPFQDLGFDSLTAVELRNRLSAVTGLRLPSTFVFRHPTPSAIADNLRQQLCPTAGDPAAPLLGELDKLETAIVGHAHDEDTRGRLAARLQSLLWRLDDTPGGAGGAGSVGDGGAVDDGELESASDDELFELIDRDLPS
ncbi:phosphopantetheine-binding protein, partial [Streptomyces aurantiacus]